MRHRSDGNQAKIIPALEKAGHLAINLSQVGYGCPDLLVARGSDGKLILLEVKADSKADYTPAQKLFRIRCPAPIYRVETPEQAVEVVRDA